MDWSEGASQRRIIAQEQMTRCLVYLDESGDLGFNFTAPYRAGGSSRYLTLAAAICCDDSNKYLKRFIADFYTPRGIQAGQERKWADLKLKDRIDFATRAAALRAQRPNISFASITVYKPNVQPHIQSDPNKLYNYMTALLLVKTLKKFDEVIFVPDPRTIQVKSGNSLHDYLQTKLWFDENVATKLYTNPVDSTKCRPLHFTDYLCGAVQSHYEDSNSQPKQILTPHMACKTLFFP
jgi:hypothetical protein